MGSRTVSSGCEHPLSIWSGAVYLCGLNACPHSSPCRRVVSHSLTVPLGMLFQPLESALARAPKTLVDLPVVGGLFVPPISAKAVARAAVRAATDSSVPAGVMDVAALQQYK